LGGFLLIAKNHHTIFWNQVMKIGEALNEFFFLKADGRPVAFHQFLGKPLLVVLLRHLA
jgi:hypothetical protein